MLNGGEARGGGGHHAAPEVVEEAKDGLKGVGGEDHAAALGEDALADPFAEFASGEDGEILVGDLELGVVGMLGEKAGEFFAGVVERDLLAVGFEKGLEAGEDERGAPGREQEPGGMAAAGEDKGFCADVFHEGESGRGVFRRVSSARCRGR